MQKSGSPFARGQARKARAFLAEGKGCAHRSRNSTPDTSDYAGTAELLSALRGENPESRLGQEDLFYADKHNYRLHYIALEE